MTLTAESITTDEVYSLRDDAAAASDLPQVALCRVALGQAAGSAPATLKRFGLARRGGGWWRGVELIGHSTKEAARQLCAEAINAARAAAEAN